MTFFESGGTDSSWHGADDPFSRLRRDRRRRRGARIALTVGVLAAVGFGAVTFVGPEQVATSAQELFAGDPPVPSADLLAVADKTFLTEEGRDLLYASKPRISTRAEVAAACDRPLDDPPAGCFSPRAGIFVHQPADPRVGDFAVTTLAHELLHAAYEQLGGGELVVLHALLEAELARIPLDDPVHAQIEWSIGEHEASRETELFAYLGSQISLEGGFAPELEAMYARWFTDRAALVAVHHRMGDVVDGVHTEVQTAMQQLAADEAGNAAERSRLEVERQWHEEARVRYADDAAEYEAIPEAERDRWIATWTTPDGVTHRESLGESLRLRASELEQDAADLQARATALESAEAATAVRRTEVEAQHTDLLALLASAYPGQSFS